MSGSAPMRHCGVCSSSAARLASQTSVGRSSTTTNSIVSRLLVDPGAPATVVECAEVALLLKDLVEADGLTPMAKTSGSKGMQVSASIRPASDERTSAYAHELAKRLEKERPDLVV